MIQKFKLVKNDFLTGTFDILFTSLISFLIFFFIRYDLSISFTAVFGLVVSICGILETLQNGLYQKPALLNFNTGFKGKNLSVYSLSFLVFIPMYFVDRTINENTLITGFLYCISYLLIQNIKSFDYYHQNIVCSSKRSLKILLGTIFYYVVLKISKNELDFNTILLGTISIRFYFIFKERKKIFALTNIIGKNRETFLFTISSFLSFLRTRLPIWLLIPFGLNFVGLYEIFRNLLEIYVFLSKSILLIFTKNLNDVGNLKTIKQATYSSFFTLIMISITFSSITKIQFFNENELKSLQSLFAISTIAFSIFIVETCGLILQNNKNFKLDILRKLLSITFFIGIFLYFYESLNFEFFVILTSVTFIFEMIFLFITKKSLKI